MCEHCDHTPPGLEAERERRLENIEKHIAALKGVKMIKCYYHGQVLPDVDGEHKCSEVWRDR